MKPSFIAEALKTALLSLALAMPFLASAQGAIEKATEPYLVKPDIRFVIASSEAKNPVVAPVVASSPVVVAPTPLFELEKGKSVEAQLDSYGKRAGWDLFWQAPEYILYKNTTLTNDFESSVIFFLKGANEAGAHLQAVFYRGNKTVRITEF